MTTTDDDWFTSSPVQNESVRKVVPANRTPSRNQGQAFADVNKGPAVSQDVQALVRAIESVEIASGEDLQAFLDRVRALCHKLAVLVSMAGGELVANVTAEARNAGKTSLINVRDIGGIRRVGKSMDRAAGDLADCAASLIGAWKTYEQFVEGVAERAGKKRKASVRKGFDLGIN